MERRCVRVPVREAGAYFVARIIGLNGVAIEWNHFSIIHLKPVAFRFPLSIVPQIDFCNIRLPVYVYRQLLRVYVNKSECRIQF